MKSICSVVLMLVLLCGLSVTAQAAEKTIMVSAAMSLKGAFEEIGAIYEKKSGVKAILNFGASGDLIRQIAGGAPVDVFASAAQKEMDEAETRRLIESSSKKIFASNSVVLIVPHASKLGLSSFADLSADRVGRIAIGNPKTAPVGLYAQEVLKYYKAADMIKDKLVFGENVRQIVDYVARNEVDAGIVYATDAMTRVKDVKLIATAPAASHRLVVYPIAIVKSSASNPAGKAFIETVLSKEGQAILRKYGFNGVK